MGISAPLELRRLAEVVISAQPLREHSKREIASVLRCLSSTPAALRALNAADRGRPRSDEGYSDMALLCLALYELHGKMAAAQAEVAKRWKLKPTSVKAAMRKYKTGAQYRLAELIDGKVGKLESSRMVRGKRVEHYWTRKELLAAVVADIDDHRERVRKIPAIL